MCNTIEPSRRKSTWYLSTGMHSSDTRTHAPARPRHPPPRHRDTQGHTGTRGDTRGQAGTQAVGSEEGIAQRRVTGVTPRGARRERPHAVSPWVTGRHRRHRSPALPACPPVPSPSPARPPARPCWPPRHRVTTPPHRHATASPCHLVTVSPRHGVTASPRHRTTRPQGATTAQSTGPGATRQRARPRPRPAGAVRTRPPPEGHRHPPAPREPAWGSRGEEGSAGGFVLFYSHRGKNERVKTTLHKRPSGERGCGPAAAPGAPLSRAASGLGLSLAAGPAGGANSVRFLFVFLANQTWMRCWGGGRSS